MKIIYKLILSYIIISFLIGIVGLLGYQASEQIITFYKEDNKNFRTIVSLANEISNSVKSAEAHFMLYITMNSEIELDEFFKQYNILNDKILALENKIHHPFSLKLLNNIKLSAKELYVQGKMLVNVYEDNIRQYGKFNPLNFKMQILNFHKLSSKIRKLGVKLAAFKTDFLNRQEAITAATEITSYVKRAEGHLMLYLTLHDNTDRNKFFERFKLLNNYINILEHKTKSSKARSLVGQIKIKTNKFYPLGIELIKAYDGEFKISKSFNFAKHTKLIDSFHNISNEIKDLGFKLTILNVNIENKIIEDKRRKAKAIQQNIYIIVACTIFISIIIAIFLSKTISKSISTLKKAAVEIGKGKLDTKINIKSKDEIGELGQIISHMANELQTHQKHLEELVDSKTIELKSAVEQLNLEIVERKLTEEALCESEARFRILAEATSEGIIIHQDGIILDVNQAIMDTVGYKNLSTLYGRCILDFVALDYHNIVIRSIYDKTVRQYEIIVLKKDGSSFPAQVKNKFTNYKGELVQLSAIRDMTEQKRVENMRENVELIVKHDLKNPLNGIMSFTELMMEKTISDDQKKYLSFIYDNTNRMYKMIDSSLDLFKMEENTYYLEPKEVDLIKCLYYIEKELSIIKKNKSLSISYKVEEKTISENNSYIIFGEQVHLETLFSNLIKNALEASPNGSQVIISIYQNKHEDFHIIDIHNLGVIPSSIKDRFFDRYVTSKKQGGTGLGTYSALLIAKTHGGNITFTSSEEDGTHLIISLPKKPKVGIF